MNSSIQKANVGELDFSVSLKQTLSDRVAAYCAHTTLIVSNEIEEARAHRRHTVPFYCGFIDIVFSVLSAEMDRPMSKAVQYAFQ